MRVWVLAATGVVAVAPIAAGVEFDGKRVGMEANGGSFVERFDRLSSSRWYISDGWTNGAHQGCTWSKMNVDIQNNALILTLKKKGELSNSFSCAEVQTKNTFGYGTYEVRMRMAAAPGLNTAFFSYIDKHAEIDFEFLGKDPKAVQLNYFAEGVGEHEHMADLGFDGHSKAANYAFQWQPDSIRWFIDGRQVHEVKRVEGKPFPEQPQKIFLSLWNGTGMIDAWLGHFDYPGKPFQANYDFVAFTKAGEPCQFPESVVCKLNAQNKQAAGKQN